MIPRLAIIPVSTTLPIFRTAFSDCAAVPAGGTGVPVYAAGIAGVGASGCAAAGLACVTAPQGAARVASGTAAVAI